MLPHDITSRFQMILGEDFESSMNAFSHERVGSFRVNTLKSTEREVLQELESKNILVEKFEKILGVYLFDREYEYAIKGTRAFYDGKIYLQSLASMLPAFVLSPRKGESILDVCSAPGSKTTQIATMIKNHGTIVAIEQNQIRYEKLLYNIRTQGAECIVGVKMDANKYFETHSDVFDKILLDAPCSAEGRIRISDEKTYGFWSIENIHKKAMAQFGLLSTAWRHLRQGGSLVYSTCTLAPEENEGVLFRFLSENQNASLEMIDIGLGESPWWKTGIVSFEDKQYGENMKKAVRILPSGETEGFFIANITKL